MSRIPNNESKASWTIKQKLENPEAARLNVSLRFESHNPGYAGYIEAVENRIDSGRGYKGKHEERGRKAGTRIVSEIINGEEFFYVTSN